jgi:PAS domain S-box-containing protein
VLTTHGDVENSGRISAAPTVQQRLRAAALPSRLVLAVLLVAASPLAYGVTTEEQVRFGLIVAFGWIPVASLWAAVAGRHPSIYADAVSLAIDLSLLVIVQLSLAQSPAVVIVAHLLIVAFYTYLDGRWMGVIAGLAGVVVIAAAVRTANTRSLAGFVLVTYPVMVACLAWLLDAAATEGSSATSRVLRLHEKSDAILTGAAEALMVTTNRGRISEWNRAAEETFACPRSKAIGRSCSDVIGLHVDVRGLDCSSGCAVLELQSGNTSGAPEDVELWRTSPTGQRQPLLATALSVVGDDGEAVEIIHSFRDVTKLKQADEAKTLFLATASHELKTPLTVIRGFSQMLLAPDTKMSPDERQIALHAIDARATQLTTIVDRLLLSSRIEAGQIDLVPEDVNIRPIVGDLATGVRAAMARDITVELDDDVPALWVDPAAFATVVDHLLDNAVKYSPGGGDITVVVDVVDDDEVEVLVTDHGVGMTEEQTRLCFERFWQAELSDIRRFGGTGIGLYIVRSLVEAMRGRISVESAPGVGSTFRVVLPRADRVVADLTGEPADEHGRGDRSIIREYMRQLGVRLDSPG